MLRNYDPLSKWYLKSWVLNSESLFDKWGFSEGNLFDDLCLDSEIDQMLPEKKVLLKMVVETFLVPKISHSVTIYEANTSHNRVRAKSEQQAQFKPVEITVTGKQIFDMLEKTN